MKKILSIFTTIALILSMAVVPAIALDKNTTTSGINVKKNSSDEKASKALENSLKKAEAQLKKVIDEESKLETTIQKAIEKANANTTKQQESVEKKISNAGDLQEKWQEELDKAAAHDKQELANLEADIAKWTDMTEKQKAALTKQLSDIDTNLTKQLDELDKKLAAAKDDVTKQNIANAKINIQKYASQKKVAINNYLSSLQGIFADRQKVWAERRDLLTRRQTTDAAFRNAMLDIKKAELNDKLASLSEVKTTPDINTIESTIRAKYKAKSDALKTLENNLRAAISDLQSKLNK